VRWLVPAALIGIAAAAGAQPNPRVPDPALQGLAAEVQAACPTPYPPPWNTLQLLDQARRVAGLSDYPGRPCRPNPALALRVVEAAADSPAYDSSEAFSMLVEFHERGIGTEADPARARLYRQRRWLITLPSGAAPFADEAELDAYVSRPETIAFLRRYAASLELPFARLRLARALFLRGRPADRERAIRLLDDPALTLNDEAIFIRARDVLVSGRGATERSRVVPALRQLVRWNHREGRILLEALARAQLAGARGPEQRWDAIEWLGEVALDGDPEHRAALLRHATTANGGRPPPRLPGPPTERFAPLGAYSISDDDYPPGALRAQESGTVRLLGLVDPRGRTIYTEPAGPGQSPRLLAAAQRIHASRRRAETDLGDARLAPYMWIELAPMIFTYEGPRGGTVRLSFSPPER
jgi:TPR repeat protein